MKYAELRSLSQVRIGRSEGSEKLYRAEDEAKRAVRAAASELAKVLPSLVSVEANDEDALALELAAILDFFGHAGAQAARLIVERYGEDDSREQDDVSKNAAASKIPRPDTVRTLAFLEELHSHSVCRVDLLCERLESCGFRAEKVLKVKGMTLNGIWIRQIVPEWGEPGIDPSAVLDAAFRAFTGETPHSQAGGRGFRFDDILDQLKTRLAEKIPN